MQLAIINETDLDKINEFKVLVKNLGINVKFIEESSIIDDSLSLISEKALEKDWLTKDEDEAWKNL